MSQRVTTGVLDSGQAAAVKRSAGRAEADRLRYEAEVLAVAEHPGVVELVGIDDEDGTVTIATSFVGLHSLETLGALPLERAAAIVAAVASTLGDLHDAGLVHGRIEPSHILVGAGGRPVLCGLAGGGYAGSIPPTSPPSPEEYRDPVGGSGCALSPTTDVFGLGAVLRTLLIDDGTDFEPIPERRFTLNRWRDRWGGYRRRALLTLADHATDDEPNRRPPARRLAAAIREIVPEASVEATAAPVVDEGALDQPEDEFANLRPRDDDPSTRPPAVRRPAVTVAVAMVVVVVFAGLRYGATRAPAAEPVAAPAPANSCPAAPTPAADVDGDGCREAVTVLDGGTVTAGGKQFTVGQTGDVVRAGDWDCDGRASLAVLRPNSGEIFLFDEWASIGNDVSVPPVATIAGATGFAPSDNGACGPLLVTRTSGPEVVVS